MKQGRVKIMATLKPVFKYIAEDGKINLGLIEYKGRFVRHECWRDVYDNPCVNRHWSGHPGHHYECHYLMK